MLKATFKIISGSVAWGGILGGIEKIPEQTDLVEYINEELSPIESNVSDLQTAVSEIDTTISRYGNIVTHDTDEFATAAQGALADTAVQSVTTGTANGTISVDNTDVSVYGLKSAAYTDSTDYATAAQGLLADTAIQPSDNISELTNDSGFITGIDSEDVITALGYTPYNAENPQNYQENVIETIEVNSTALTPSEKTVNITVPTDTSDLTNNAGFITSSAISSMQTTTNLVTSVSQSSTDSEYPSAKLLYDQLEDKQNKSTAVTHTASTATGSATKGVYIASNGTATEMTYSVNKDVPSNAVFTDTTYSVMTGADGTSAGTSGLVPQPAATDNTKYLRGDGEWETPPGATYNVFTGATSQVAGSNGLVPAPAIGDNTAFLSGAATWVQSTSSVTQSSTSLLTSGGAYSAISAITDLIPQDATSSNQLADKSFVNSSISSNTANFIGTFSSVSDLENYSGTVTNNDYAFVTSTDSAGNTIYNRYKYNSTTQTWNFEYAINNSSFTSSQWSAINSGITSSTKVTHTANTIVGSSTQPVYIASDGAATACTYSLEKSVPSNAVFTDTTYSAFGGADGTNAGSSGLVPAPTATDNTKFLKGDGTWTAISMPTVDQTFNSASQNAQSGVAINGELSTNYQSKLTSGTNIKTINNESILGEGNITISSGTTYTGGTGISIDANNAINHTNSVTAGTAGTSSATSGSTLSVPYVTYDAQGHITATGTHTHTVTGFSTTDTKYTACSYNTASKIYLIGATSQGSSTSTGTQTYSNSSVYAQSGYLYATTPASTQNDTTVATTKFVKDQGYTSNTGTVTSVCSKSPTNGNVALSASDVSAVPTTRTVNGKALSSNISLTASDVGAMSSSASVLTTVSYNSSTQTLTIS